jgi:hypothetical protein
VLSSSNGMFITPTGYATDATASDSSRRRLARGAFEDTSSGRRLLFSGAPPWYAFPPAYLRRGPADNGYSDGYSDGSGGGTSRPAPAPPPLPLPKAHAIGHIGSLPEDDEWAPGAHKHHNIDDDDDKDDDEEDDDEVGLCSRDL